MSIAEVRSYALSSPLEEAFHFSQPGSVTRRSTVLVEVVDDDGRSGWGEALCHGLQPPGIAKATVDEVLRELYVGRDPHDVAVLHHVATNRLRDFGRDGAVMSAVSAVDIAVWDLLGRVLDLPLHRLLGGAHRSRLVPYATGFYRTATTSLADLVEEARRHQRAGFSAMKVKVGFGVDEDLATLAAIRDAVGDDVLLMADANHAYNGAVARRLVRGCDEVGLHWLEEPIPPEDLVGYGELRAMGSDVLIAMGESECGARGTWPVARARAADVYQPDLAVTGGFTAMRELVPIAHAAGMLVNPHVWGTAVGLAASVQLLATLPPNPISRGQAEPLLEYDSSDHPFRRRLVDEPIVVADGVVEVPDAPGIGVRVDRDVLDDHRIA
jgi:D-galactarolactone cycloisomerase